MVYPGNWGVQDVWSIDEVTIGNVRENVDTLNVI